MIRYRAFPAVPALLLSVPGFAGDPQDAGEGKRLQQMSLEELLNLKVTVATRTETPLLEVPSVVSIITANDIRRMGARDLRDVLRTVPGFDIGVRGQLGYPQFGLRGVVTDNTEKIRFLVDGVPVNEHLEGSGTIVFGDLALDNIERIEIIRGPGSALYGTSAFLGVVSLITKDAAVSGGSTTVTARGGSFRTGEGSVLTGWSGPKVRFSAYVHHLDTEGPKSAIGQDAIQLLDTPPFWSSLNAGISLAGTPAGVTQEWRRKTTAQLKLDLQGVLLNAYYVDAKKGPYLGIYHTVNEGSEPHPSQLQLSVSTKQAVGPDWTLEPKLYAIRYVADNLWNNAPPGYRALDAGGNPVTYTQGEFERHQASQLTRGAEVKATWAPSAAHKALFGAAMEEIRLYGVHNYANLPGQGAAAMPESPLIMRKVPISRALSNLFAQDQWSLAEQVTLTAGARLDHYNDAGSSLSPRLGLVWIGNAFHAKFMAGDAFRAPTFVESYLNYGGGLLQGRADNRPERIRSLEAEGGWRNARAFFRAVVFENRIKDLLRLVPLGSGLLEYANVPDVTRVQGLEVEGKVAPSALWSLSANATFQSGRNLATREAVVGMAHWFGHAEANLALTETFNAHLTFHAVGRRERAAGDARPELKGYTGLDLALTYAPTPTLECSLAAHNLGDADQRQPSLSLPLPGDFPLQGRSLMAGLRWRF